MRWRREARRVITAARFSCGSRRRASAPLFDSKKFFSKPPFCASKGSFNRAGPRRNRAGARRAARRARQRAIERDLHRERNRASARGPEREGERGRARDRERALASGRAGHWPTRLETDNPVGHNS
jgi:hypothetical protein